MSAKSIRPLSAFAEVKTLDGSITMKSHFFSNCGQTGYIQVREIACLTCTSCQDHKYRQCENVSFCGGLLTKPVSLKRGGRDEAVETRYCNQLKENGTELAKQVQPGTMVGSECTNETEPYIVSLALSAEKIWEGEPGKSWMGRIEAGMCLDRTDASNTYPLMQVTNTSLPRSL
jgi:hypothetical protein